MEVSARATGPSSDRASSVSLSIAPRARFLERKPEASGSRGMPAGPVTPGPGPVGVDSTGPHPAEPGRDRLPPTAGSLPRRSAQHRFEPSRARGGPAARGFARASAARPVGTARSPGSDPDSPPGSRRGSGVPPSGRGPGRERLRAPFPLPQTGLHRIGGERRDLKTSAHVFEPREGAPGETCHGVPPLRLRGAAGGGAFAALESRRRDERGFAGLGV